ncbi:MAG: GNAT family N-acetyltransferase [Enterobacteriaceae bacterium]|jgi:hypothetical protein|nr:GNAT family N-acetyltransferase [Enterobacteriaceae bacterium]
MKMPGLFQNILSRIQKRESPKERYIRLFETTIREVNQAEMFIALMKIKINTSDWYSTLNSSISSDIARHGTFNAVSHEIENIYQNPKEINATKYHRYFICLSQNTPVGIMTFVPGGSSFFNESSSKIGFMLTHPGSHGCGSLLVEKAVELLTEDELLVSAKPYSVPFYKNLGFEQYGINSANTTSMRLTPSESEKWVFSGTHYRLRQYI